MRLLSIFTKPKVNKSGSIEDMVQKVRSEPSYPKFRFDESKGKYYFIDVINGEFKRIY